MSTIFHIALRSDWEPALAEGRPYTMSTRGRTLAEEGFIHCSADAEQASGVLARFYADVDPGDLVFLAIDTERLDAEVRHEEADGLLFPHIYGPIPPSAVIDVSPVPGNR